MTATNGRNPALDGLRTLAIAFVILNHTATPGFDGGFIGVDVFFVLSGYLITGILMQEAESIGEIRIGRFLLQRALRLMPPLALMLTCVIALKPLLWPNEEWLGVSVFLAAIYMTDYASAILGPLPIVGHTWSLSVEEHFYLIWPLAVVGLATLPGRKRIKALLIAVVVAILWRTFNAWWFPDSFWVTQMRFDTRLSGLLLGALLAILRPRLKPATADAIGLPALAMVIILAMLPIGNAPVLVAYLQPAIDIASMGLVASLTVESGRIARAFSWPPVAWIGLISYSIYLWHFPIIQAVRIYADDWPVQLVATLFFSIVISALSFVYIERPINSWRRRKFAFDAHALDGSARRPIV